MATGTCDKSVALPGLLYNLQGCNAKVWGGEPLSGTEIESLFFLFGGYRPGAMAKDWNIV